MRDKKQWTMRHIGPNHPSALQILRTQQRFKKMLNINIVKIKRLLTQSYKIDKVRLHM